MITPLPPCASFTLPWDDPEAPDPVTAITAARETLGDSFVVTSGGTTYWFVFAPAGLDAFYGVAEASASKGLADYRMLVRKLPPELFGGRRTFAHDLFGGDAVTGYLAMVDAAIGAAVAALPDDSALDVFAFARDVGHRIATACWFGTPDPPASLVADLDVLDAAEAFVRPASVVAHEPEAERAAFERIVTFVADALTLDRAASFLDDISERWADVRTAPTSTDDTHARGVAGDLVLLHLATMTNLFAAIGWAITWCTAHGVADDDLDDAAYEAVRLGQRSIMLREVLRPISFDDGTTTRTVDPGTMLATMLPVTNLAADPTFDPSRWRRRGAHHDLQATTFGHGDHRCPAQRFSVQAITRTVRALRRDYDLAITAPVPGPLPMQIGGMARPATPVTMRAVRRSVRPAER